jgi:bleomycin hydrolase
MKSAIAFTFFFVSTISVTYSQVLEGYDMVKFIPTTEVKDQGYSGTCWSFATVSFLETEILREKNIEVDLSEMFVVRWIYPEKAKNYFRTQGNSFFTAGGQPHDVLMVMESKGLVPETSYEQNLDFVLGYNTEELDTAAFKYVKSLRKSEKEIIPIDWLFEFEEILNSNLGIPPNDFTFNNQQYTPKQFCENFLSLDANNYIEITSFNHHPYNEYFCLESRYNWALKPYYNVELKTFMSIIENAIMNGFSVVFNGDISEESFDYIKGLAVSKSSIGDEVLFRQELFETGSSTVDHVMHIVGIAKGKDGKKYFITKNSWGTGYSCSGYMYLSEDYLKFKAISILVNREALKSK